MSDTTPVLLGGEYRVRAICPSCDEPAIVPLHITSRLVVVRDEAAVLGLKVKAAKVPHDCGQLTLEAAVTHLDREKR